MTSLERAAYQPIAELIPYLGYGEKDNANDLYNMHTYGHKNYTFIAKYFDDLWNSGYKFYNTRKQTGEWCDMTVDFSMCMAFGPENARKVLYQPMESCGAGCAWSASYYRANNAWTSTPKTGDQIFFGPKGNESHTGIVEKVEGGYVHTIEGNTSDKLMRRKYALNESKIAGYGRPNYKLVTYLFEEDDMTREETIKIAEEVVQPVYAKLEDIQTQFRVIHEAFNELSKSIGPMIKNYKDVPWESIKPNVRWMLDNGVIDGGTPYETNPDDIGLPLQLLRVLVCSDRDATKRVENLEQSMPCWRDDDVE